jgi:hypothetical protein
MEEARSVLERFERIESMRRANAGPVELLGELRASSARRRRGSRWKEVMRATRRGALRQALARDMIAA